MGLQTGHAEIHGGFFSIGNNRIVVVLYFFFYSPSSVVTLGVLTASVNAVFNRRCPHPCPAIVSGPQINRNGVQDIFSTYINLF